jgi:hypothetical protein
MYKHPCPISKVRHHTNLNIYGAKIWSLWEGFSKVPSHLWNSPRVEAGLLLAQPAMASLMLENCKAHVRSSSLAQSKRSCICHKITRV